MKTNFSDMKNQSVPEIKTFEDFLLYSDPLTLFGMANANIKLQFDTLRGFETKVMMRFINEILFPVCSKEEQNKISKMKVSEDKNQDWFNDFISRKIPNYEELLLKIALETKTAYFFFIVEDYLNIAKFKKDSIPFSNNLKKIPKEDKEKAVKAMDFEYMILDNLFKAMNNKDLTKLSELVPAFNKLDFKFTAQAIS